MRPANQMICVVSHDAGGAEVLAGYIAKHSLECAYVLAGPAVLVFERKFGRLAIPSLEEALGRCDLLLCGTSWQSDLEWTAMGIARREGKRSVAFLDHWVHYRERFVRNGEERLPDEVWVGDSIAMDTARKCFPRLPVRLVPNPYVEDLKRELAVHRKLIASDSSISRGLKVLFVCEPLSEHGLLEFGDERHWGYTEYDALRYFLFNLFALGKPVDIVVVRPHPSEPTEKYDWVRDEFGERIVVGGDRLLLEEVLESDVVAGCESMAMVVGLIAGRRVISCIPPGGKACGLPQPEIESLAKLIAAMNPP